MQQYRCAYLKEWVGEFSNDFDILPEAEADAIILILSGALLKLQIMCFYMAWSILPRKQFFYARQEAHTEERDVVLILAFLSHAWLSHLQKLI